MDGRRGRARVSQRRLPGSSGRRRPPRCSCGAAATRAASRRLPGLSVEAAAAAPAVSAVASPQILRRGSGGEVRERCGGLRPPPGLSAAAAAAARRIGAAARPPIFLRRGVIAAASLRLVRGVGKGGEHTGAPLSRPAARRRRRGARASRRHLPGSSAAVAAAAMRGGVPPGAPAVQMRPMASLGAWVGVGRTRGHTLEAAATVGAPPGIGRRRGPSGSGRGGHCLPSARRHSGGRPKHDKASSGTGWGRLVMGKRAGSRGGGQSADRARVVPQAERQRPIRALHPGGRRARTHATTSSEAEPRHIGDSGGPAFWGQRRLGVSGSAPPRRVGVGSATASGLGLTLTQNNKIIKNWINHCN